MSTSSATLLPTAKGDQLVVKRPMGLSERMAVLAAAISIDCDFFSRRGSWYGGWAHMLIPLPVPPVPVDGAMGGAAAAADAPPGGPSPGAETSSESLKDDGFAPDSFDGELLDEEGGVPGLPGAAAAGGVVGALAEILGL